MRKKDLKKGIGSALAVVICLCSHGIYANEITSDEVVKTSDGAYVLKVAGKTEQPFSDVKVNLWLYKGESIVHAEQTSTNSNGEYGFSVNMSKFTKGGMFKVKTIAQTEDSAEKEFDFYSAEELDYLYKDLLFDEIDAASGVTNQNTENIAKALNDYQNIMTFTDKRYAAVLSNDKRLRDTAAFIADEIAVMKAGGGDYDKNKLTDMLVYT